ncbi:MAG: hypothetical protein FP831_06170 [Anaerolineae bacterium]|nr:hypothetical protein [Anaerolineae bacterium]
MDKSDPDHPLPTENSSPAAQGEQFINLEAKSSLKTTVTITLEAGASLDLIVSQVDADGKPVSLQRKSFTNALKPHAVLEPEPPLQAEPANPNPVEKQAPARKPTWQVWLIGLALLVYLVTRFIGLDA